MTSSISLPARLDSKNAPGLAEELMALADTPVRIDASSVTVGSTLCLQVLVAEARQWSGAGRDFAVESPSKPFLDACAILGLSPADIGIHLSPEGQE